MYFFVHIAVHVYFPVPQFSLTSLADVSAHLFALPRPRRLAVLLFPEEPTIWVLLQLAVSPLLFHGPQCLDGANDTHHLATHGHFACDEPVSSLATDHPALTCLEELNLIKFNTRLPLVSNVLLPPTWPQPCNVLFLLFPTAYQGYNGVVRDGYGKPMSIFNLKHK